MLVWDNLESVSRFSDELNTLFLVRPSGGYVSTVGNTNITTHEFGDVPRTTRVWVSLDTDSANL